MTIGSARHAWIDASAGVAGDMLLGALVDAGADLSRVSVAVEAVAPGLVAIEAHEVVRAGQRATKVEVRPLEASPHHRHWSEIRSLLEAAVLAEPVRDRALATFAALARAEGRAHGVDPEEVHFHEVGAWDSIADVVGVCAALDDLGVETVSAGPVAVGSGTVHAAHGEMPVPVPAVAELSRGWRVRAGGEGELATPTGMALVTALAERCEDLPDLVADAVGVGAGTRDTPGRPNVVRVVLGSLAAEGDPSLGASQAARPAAASVASQADAERPGATGAPSAGSRPDADSAGNRPDASSTESRPDTDPTGNRPDAGSTGSRPDADSAGNGPDTSSTGNRPAAGSAAPSEEMVQLDTNVDDIDPRLWPGVLAALLDAGAADAWLTPIVMKKGRPAHTLSVLAHAADAEALVGLIFELVPTLGVRRTLLTRTALAREFRTVEVAGVPVRIKLGVHAGAVITATPEFADVAALAASLAIPEREALARAQHASAEAGLPPRWRDAR